MLLAAKGAHQSSHSLRVEPAFSRSLDYLVGKGLAHRAIRSNRLTFELTSSGSDAAQSLASSPTLFLDEQAFLRTAAKALTETLVNTILRGRSPSQ